MAEIKETDKNGQAQKETIRDGQPVGGGSPGQSERALNSTAEDVLFSFFRKYITLLTAVASLPILATGLNAIPLPEGEKGPKLSIISSLICVIMLGATILSKNWVTWAVASRHRVTRLIPIGCAVIFLGVGVALTCVYMQKTRDAQNAIVHSQDTASPSHETAASEEPQNFDGHKPPLSIAWIEACYLMILPCYVTALGIILIASHSLFYGLELEKSVERSNLDSKTFAYLKNVITDYVKFFSNLADDSKTENFSLAVMNQISDCLDNLNKGEVKSSSLETARLQKIVLEHFQHSVSSVCSRELVFWVNDHTPLRVAGDGLAVRESQQLESSKVGSARGTQDDNLTAKELLQFDIDAIWRGMKVTRIFVCEDHDLYDEQHGGIGAVLQKHEELEIGWALVPLDDLPPTLKEDSRDLNFAQLDGKETFVLFQRSRIEGFVVKLNVPSNRKFSEDHERLLKNLMTKCCIASKRFCEMHHGFMSRPLADAKGEFKNDLGGPKHRNGRVAGSVDVQETNEAVEYVRNLRLRNVLSGDNQFLRTAVGMRGEWTYAAEGTDNKGRSYNYTGNCRAVILGRGLYLVGQRMTAKVSGNDAPEGSNAEHATWKSGRLQVGPSGVMEFEYMIHAYKREIRGVCHTFSFASNSKSTLKGTMLTMLTPDTTLEATLILKRGRDSELDGVQTLDTEEELVF